MSQNDNANRFILFLWWIRKNPAYVFMILFMVSTAVYNHIKKGRMTDEEKYKSVRVYYVTNNAVDGTITLRTTNYGDITATLSNVIMPTDSPDNTCEAKLAYWSGKEIHRIMSGAEVKIKFLPYYTITENKKEVYDGKIFVNGEDLGDLLLQKGLVIKAESKDSTAMRDWCLMLNTIEVEKLDTIMYINQGKKE